MELYLWGAWESIKSFIYLAWTAFKWPHAALIISYFLISNFKAEFRGAIGRLNKLGPAGVEFGPVPAPEEMQGDRDLVIKPVGVSTGTLVDDPSTEESKKTPTKKLVIPLPPYGVTQCLVDTKSNILSEIEGMQPVEVTEYLISRLAMMRVLYDFETIYSSIFGGQIKFLNYLNQRLATGCAMSEVEAYWETHKLQFAPHMDAWTVDNYLEFLRFRGLIRSVGSAIFLTTKGHEFLVWLMQSGKSQEKPW